MDAVDVIVYVAAAARVHRTHKRIKNLKALRNPTKQARRWECVRKSRKKSAKNSLTSFSFRFLFLSLYRCQSDKNFKRWTPATTDRTCSILLLGFRNSAQTGDWAWTLLGGFHSKPYERKREHFVSSFNVFYAYFISAWVLNREWKCFRSIGWFSNLSKNRKFIQKFINIIFPDETISFLLADFFVFFEFNLMFVIYTVINRFQFRDGVARL